MGPVLAPCKQAATAPLCCRGCRKEVTVHAMPGLVVAAALARQAGSAVISKMRQRRQINNKAGGCPLKPTGRGGKGTGPLTV